MFNDISSSSFVYSLNKLKFTFLFKPIHTKTQYAVNDKDSGW